MDDEYILRHKPLYEDQSRVTEMAKLIARNRLPFRSLMVFQPTGIMKLVT